MISETGRLRLKALCTPAMGEILWGASPLCKNGSLREISYQSITLIGKARGEGNRAGATQGGKKARQCAVKRTGSVVVSRILTSVALLSNGNVLQGRRGQASGHNTTKPFPIHRADETRACATTDHVPIRGDLPHSRE